MHLLGQVQRIAAERGLQSMAITFRAHPKVVLSGAVAPKVLTTAEERIARLQQAGIQRIEMLDFTPQLAALSAKEFMQHLADKLQVRVLVIGYDHRFGRGRAEGFEDYVAYGRELGIDVVRAEELSGGISSTAIREALQNADIATANQLLGYDYSISGEVVHGYHKGSAMGYPTANISVPSDKLLPMDGAYCVRVNKQHVGMLNIGVRPTMKDGGERSVEVHILDFDKDMYGAHITLEFVSFLRREKHFDSLDQLCAQLHEDERKCRKYIRK